jgi:hypothetical protein
MITSTPTTPIQTAPIQTASDLPPPLNDWKEMLAYPLTIKFHTTAQLEGDFVTKRGTYEKVNHLPSVVKIKNKYIGYSIGICDSLIRIIILWASSSTFINI